MYWKTLVFLLLLTSCNSKDRLVGHWHFHAVGKYRPIASIDFLESDSVIFNKNSIYDSYPATWKPRINFIPGGGECRVLDIAYHLDGDTLRMMQTELGGRFLATRCDDICCDRQAEFFDPLDMEVDLPVLDSSFSNSLTYESHLFDKSLFLGDTGYYAAYNAGKMRLKIGNKFASVRDIRGLAEMELMKLRYGEEGSKRFRYILFFHQSASHYDFYPILERLKDTGVERVYLAGRTAKVNGREFAISLLPVSLDHLQTFDPVEYGQWIRAQF